MIVSIPSGGIILFPLVQQGSCHAGRRGFPSRLAGLSYFHLIYGHPTRDRVRYCFHPVWRDYPISTKGGGWFEFAVTINVSIPSGGIILFPHELTRIYTSPQTGFHPVWRDYPISTSTLHLRLAVTDPVSIPSGGIILFPQMTRFLNRLFEIIQVSIPSGGIILFPHEPWRLVEGGHDGFHPVWRDYPISTSPKDSEREIAETQVSIPSGGIILFPRSGNPGPGGWAAILVFPSRLAGLSYFHCLFLVLIFLLALTVGFPSRLAGLSYFHSSAAILRRHWSSCFHPVWRDYPISTRKVFDSAVRAVEPCFHPVWRDYPISTGSVPPGWPPCMCEYRFPSRLAGLSYFHNGLPPTVSQVNVSVSIPSGGIILFPPVFCTPVCS